jgi:diguanylate cyclase (GGDEF)-like protein
MTKTLRRKDIFMNNTMELKYSTGLLGRESYFFKWLLKIGEDAAEKNRELLLENLDLQSEIERLKRFNFIDDTTGIHNKRYLQIRLREEFARARRHGFSLSSVFIDLDDFKSVNDTYGHIVGDRLLKEVASVLEGLCRGEDALVRFGGEEFVILMSDTDDHEAVTLAERIRKEVAGHLFFCEGVKISLSVSIGVSTFNSDDFEYVNDPEELIGMADRAMYAVKQNGKNNTCYLPFRLEKGAPLPSGSAERQYDRISL